jgi:PAS domain S-box-containing protein
VLGTAIPFVSFFPSVMISAWFGGFGPGLLSTFFSTVLALYVANHGLVIADGAELIRLLLFFLISVSASWLYHLLHRARSSTEMNLAYLRLVIDGVPGLVSYIDRQYKYRFSNRAYREWFQRPDLNLNGMSVTEIAGDEGLALIRPHLDRALAGERVTYERRITYPDRERDVRVAYIPDRGGNDHIRGVVVLVEDITEEKRAAEKLRERDQHLRALVENSSDGVLLLDREATVLFSGAPILGYAIEEWRGRNGLELLHPGDRPSIVQEFARLSQTPGGKLRVRYRARHKDGSWRWIEGICRNLLDEPAVGGIVVNYRDITEQKHIEEHLREQAQLLDLAPDAILVLAWDGTIEFWNRGAADRYGWSREEALGKTAHELLKTEFPEPLVDIKAKLARDGYWHGELTQTKRDGTRISIASRWALRRTEDEQPAGYLEIATDITERKHAEERLRQTAKLESLGVLAGGIAHDFNNLLIGIMGNASLALENTGALHPNREPLQEVIAASQRAADLTRQMLAYAGKGRFVVHRVNISELIRELIPLIRMAIPKHVQLQLDLRPDLPTVEADVGQLQQVVMNLVINGAEAVVQQSGVVVVSTRAQEIDDQYLSSLSIPQDLPRGSYVVLEVHDTGSGMNDSTIAKIFDPFFTTKFQGRGLGLAAVQGIVRGHRGGLTVHSILGKGTTFRVLLPAIGGPPSPLPVSDVIVRTRLDDSGLVLVIDDEEIVRDMARNTLERYGYSVVLARNGQQGIEAFQSREGGFRLVLLDLTMPVMGGEETLRELRLLDPEVTVVLSSGFSEAEAVQRFGGERFSGFLQKPYTASALAAKVKQALAGAS